MCPVPPRRKPRTPQGIEPAIREHAKGGALPAISAVDEEDSLQTVLRILEGPDRALYGSALTAIERAGVTSPETVPAGLVERVAELMGERETRESGHAALKHLILRGAASPAHEEGIFRAERRRLATILEDVVSATDPHRFGAEVIKPQVWGKHNPTLASLFKPGWLAGAPPSVYWVLVAFCPIFQKDRVDYDPKLGNRPRAAPSGFDPQFLQAIPALLDSSVGQDAVVKAIDSLHRFGAGTSGTQAALTRIALTGRNPEAGRLVIPGLVEQRDWLALGELLAALPSLAREVTKALATLVARGDSLEDATALLDRLPDTDDLRFSLWELQKDAGAIAAHLMSEPVLSGARRTAPVRGELANAVVAILSEEAARSSTAALEALAALGGADLDPVTTLATRLCEVPDRMPFALAVLARGTREVSGLFARYAQALQPTYSGRLLLHLLAGVARHARGGLAGVMDEADRNAGADVAHAVCGLIGHGDRRVRHEALHLLQTFAPVCGPAEAGALVDVVAGDDPDDAMDALWVLLGLAERGIEVSRVEAHLPKWIDRFAKEEINVAALLLADGLSRRRLPFPAAYRDHLPSWEHEAVGEQVVAVLRRLLNYDSGLRAWLRRRLKTEQRHGGPRGERMGEASLRLLAVCASSARPRRTRR